MVSATMRTSLLSGCFLAAALGGLADTAHGLAHGLAHGTAHGAAQEPDRFRAEAAEALIVELDGYVAECQKRKLYAERDEICSRIIELQPDHEIARKWLGHKRSREGGWKEPARRRNARDFDAEALPEMHARLEGIVAGYVAQLSAYYDQNAERISPTDRDELFADILRFDEDNALVRGFRGEVLWGDRWILIETARGVERRAELAELIRRAEAEAPEARPVEANARESALGIRLTHSLAAPFVRVHATGPIEEPQRAVEILAVTQELFEWALRAEGSYPPDFTLFMLRTASEKTQLLNKHPQISERYRAFLSQIEAAVIAESHDFAVWSEDQARRYDAVVRMSTNWLAADAFRILRKQGWIFESLGLFMSQKVLGTRLYWTVQPDRYENLDEPDALRAKLIRPDTDWRREAWLMLKDKSVREKPILDALLRKDVIALETREVLYAYVLMLYLIEGRPDEVSGIMRRFGVAQDDPRVILEEELGLDLDSLERRLVRWLEESGAPGGTVLGE